MKILKTYTDGVVGQLTSDDMNQIKDEEQNAILCSQVLSSSDSNQLSKHIAIASMVNDCFVDSGTANTYILSSTGSFENPISYIEGMKIRFKPKFTNTGASTINVTSLGFKPIKRADGSSLVAGDIVQDIYIQLIYNGSQFLIDKFILGDATITESKLATNSVTVNKISNGAVNEITKITFSTTVGHNHAKTNGIGNNSTPLDKTAFDFWSYYGENSTLIGKNAGHRTNSNGMIDDTVAIGVNALYLDGYTKGNVAVGVEALYNSYHEHDCGVEANIGEGQNTAVGHYAGKNITAGKNNTVIGYNAQVPSNTGDNQVRIGGQFVSYAGVQVAWTITSDKRYKEDIKQLELGLDFINELNSVEYKRIGNNRDEKEFGLIAQELEKVLDSKNIKNSGLLTKDDNGYLSIRYNDLIPCLIKSVQELSQKNIDLENRIKQLENKSI